MVHEKEPTPKASTNYYVTGVLLRDLRSRLGVVEEALTVHLPAAFQNAAHPDYKENSPKDVLDHEWGMSNQERTNLIDKIGRSVVVDDIETDAVIVEPGAVVTITRERGDSERYLLLSLTDADRGYLSIDSPIGSSIIGKKIGEISVVDLPGNKIEYVIVKQIESFKGSGFDRSESGGIAQKNTPSSVRLAVMENDDSVAPSTSATEFKTPATPSGKVINRENGEKVRRNQDIRDRYDALVKFVDTQGYPVSTRNSKVVKGPDEDVTQSIIIFNDGNSLVKVILSASSSLTKMEAFRFLNGAWQPTQK